MELQIIDQFIYNYLRKKINNIKGWKLDYNRCSSEIMWVNDHQIIYATPFWDSDQIMSIMLESGDKFKEIEKIDIFRDYNDIINGRSSIYQFIALYLNIIVTIIDKINNKEYNLRRAYI